MSKIISREEASSLALEAQGLHSAFSFGKEKGGALQTIRHLGYVQLDTLAVVARAHHHTLWTRTHNYNENHLAELVRERKIFEYWSHAAAYLPIEDFRFSLPRKEEHRKGRSHWFVKDKKVMKYVLDRIRADGPLQSKDFETDRTRGSWFDWKPAKIALEHLFHDGTLMVHERKGFQKVYDLTERIIPAAIDTRIPTKEEYAAHLIHATIRAHGLASARDIAHLRRGMQQPVIKMMRKMLKSGELVQVQVRGIEGNYFALPSNEPQNSSSLRGTSILSPFDNAVIRRERLLKLFNYDYAIECYLPEGKRRFGYFCLPVLHNGKFVGRFDPKADREKKTFLVKQLYIEHEPESADEFVSAFGRTLKQFAEFNGCPRIVVDKTNPAKIKSALMSTLKESGMLP